MRVLVTNDDGYQATGIQVLARAARALGEVTIVAPDREQSATSHSLTLHAGMGDLVLTCTGDLSRNRTVGVRLGRGEPLSSILAEMRAVAEGVKTAQAARDLAERHEVEMPITSEVHAILVEGRSARESLLNLMERDPKPEEWA